MRTDGSICPAASEQTSEGGALAWGQGIDLPITMQPCETATITVLANASGSLVNFRLLTASLAIVSDTFWTPNGPADARSIFYRATRGLEGRPASMRLTAWIGGITSYTITVRKAPRAGYNTGGTGFANAPVIVFGQPLAGNLLATEPGQFFRLHLAGRQTMGISGRAQGDGLDGTLFTVTVFDAAQQPVQPDLVTLVASVELPFPESGNGPLTYMNPSSSDTDVYLRARTQGPPPMTFTSSCTRPCWRR